MSISDPPPQRLRADIERLTERPRLDLPADHPAARLEPVLEADDEMLPRGPHIAHPDGRIIPFDTYNLFYRDDREETLLNRLRGGLEAMDARGLATLHVRGEEVRT